MKITYYVEILSSWCYWAEPTWRELQRRYAGQVEFTWRIALMKPEDFPSSREQCDWFYRRSGTIVRSPFALHSGWCEPELAGHYEVPNHVAEAGREFGINDDRLRLALTEAAVREGKKVGRMEVALEVVRMACGLDPVALRAAAESSAVIERVRRSTADFHARQLTQRPAFVLENKIGDYAAFSGLTQVAPLAATIDAMLADAAAYQSHAAHFGPPPLA